jgi:hypothetical protein
MREMKTWIVTAALAFAGLACAPARADDALTLKIYQGDNLGILHFDSMGELFTTFNHENKLAAALPSWYVKSSNSSARLEYLGVEFVFTFSAGTQTYTMEIPGIGFDQKAYSGNRDSALAKMKQDIKDRFGTIQTLLIASSPNSLVAGNPASLQSQMASGQFDTGFASMTSVLGPTPSTATSGQGGVGLPDMGSSDVSGGSGNSSSRSLKGVGLRFGQYNLKGLHTQSTTLPLSYVWRFDEDDERRSITFSLPLTGGRIEGSKVYSAQGGLSMGIPMNTVWTLTPALGYGITGSGDLLQASQQVSVSLTSAYAVPLDDGYLLSFGNMAGYYSAVKLQIKDYQSGGDVHNTILRNGALLAVPMPHMSLLGDGLAMELSFIHTQFFGSALFVNSMVEAGLTLGTDKRAQGLKTYIRAGVSFTVAKDSNGIAANFGYWF